MSNQTNETNHLIQYTQPSTDAHKAHYSKKSKLISSLRVARIIFHFMWVLLSFTYINRVIGGVFLQINPNTPDWVAWVLSLATLWFSHGLLFSSLESNLYTWLDEDDSTKVDMVDWGLCAGLFLLLLFVGVKGAPEAIAAFSKKENKEMLSFSDVEQQVAQQKADAKDAFDESIRDINKDIERETNKAAAAANSEIARLTHYKPHDFKDKVYAEGLLRKAEQQKAAVANNIEAKYNAQKKPFRAQYNATLARIDEDAKAVKASKKQVIDDHNAKLDVKDATIVNLGLGMELAFGFLCLLTTFLYVRNRVLCGIIPKARYTELDASGNLTIWGYVISDVFKRKNQYQAITWHMAQGAKYAKVIRPDGTVVATDGNYLSVTKKTVELPSDKGGSDSSQGGGSSPKPTPTTPPQVGAPEGGSNPLSRPVQATKKEAAPTAEAVAGVRAMERMKSTFSDLEEGTAEWREVFNGLFQDYLFPERKAAKEQAAIEKGLYKPSIGIPNPIAESSFPTLPNIEETVKKERATPDETPSPIIENTDVVIELDVARRGEAKSTEKTAKGDDVLKYRSGQIARYHGNWNTDRSNESVHKAYIRNLDAVLQVFVDGQYDYSTKVLAWFSNQLNLWESHITQNGFQYDRMDTIRGYIAEYQDSQIK